MKLKMFGGFQLIDDHADQSLLRLKRGQALVAYLASKDSREESREYLTDLLWPNRFRKQAQASLRQVLFEIRNQCGNGLPVVEASRTHVRLGGAIEECDLWIFDTCTSSADPGEAELALNLYRGPFLDGPGIGSEPFAQWVAIQQARLEGQLETLVLAAANECNKSGQDKRACELLDRLLHISPLCYRAAMMLLEIDAAHGRTSDALRRFERYVRHLKLEYDQTPPDELNDAFRMLRQSPASSPQFSAPRRDPAFAGEDPWKKRSNDAPVIAVLPFKHLANKNLGDELAAAISEDITMMLSGCKWFKVLSRGATHSVASQESLVISEFVQRTGADYLIYGALSERGGKWSVTVELADAPSGIIKWAKRFEAPEDGILSWVDQVCPQIVAELDPAVAENEMSVTRKPALSATTSLPAYQQLVVGYRDFYSGNWTGALQKFASAADQDPTYAHAHAMMAVVRYLDAQVNRREVWREQLADAESNARRALEIDPSEAKACNILGQILDWQGQHKESLTHLQRAATINPSFAWSSTAHSYHAVMMGEFDEAKSYIQTAMRLRVGDSGLGLCLPARALADLHLGNVQDALDTAHWAIRMQPNFWLGRQVLAACQLAAGQERDAGKMVEALKQDYEGISSEEFANWFPYGREEIDKPLLRTLQHFEWQ